jgi:hypothetical protein
MARLNCWSANSRSKGYISGLDLASICAPHAALVMLKVVCGWRTKQNAVHVCSDKSVHALEGAALRGSTRLA